MSELAISIKDRIEHARNCGCEVMKLEEFLKRFPAFDVERNKDQLHGFIVFEGRLCRNSPPDEWMSYDDPVILEALWAEEFFSALAGVTAAEHDAAVAKAKAIWEAERAAENAANRPPLRLVWAAPDTTQR